MLFGGERSKFKLTDKADTEKASVIVKEMSTITDKLLAPLWDNREGILRKTPPITTL